MVGFLMIADATAVTANSPASATPVITSSHGQNGDTSVVARTLRRFSFCPAGIAKATDTLSGMRADPPWALSENAASPTVRHLALFTQPVPAASSFPSKI